MKILKYKKTKTGKYKVFLEYLELELYEEVILKYELLLKKELSDDLIDQIKKNNMYYEIYYFALRLIKNRFRSIYDTKQLLTRKEFNKELVESVIEKLTHQGYLNDESYAKSFINNKIVTSNYGPIKIKNELLEHRVDSNIIDIELEVFDDELQIERIEKLANRFYKSNRNRGGNVLKRKITSDLINYGYDISLIEKVINKFDYTQNEDIAKKEYEKIYNKLSRKYDGAELKRKIKEKMYLKGLKYEEN